MTPPRRFRYPLWYRVLLGLMVVSLAWKIAEAVPRWLGVFLGVVILLGSLTVDLIERRRRAAEAMEAARVESLARMLSLEHELGILGHECGPECPPPDEPTALYRLFPQDAQTGEAPLYIGLSAYESMRQRDYRPETRVEVEWFPSREDANAARFRAILDERPRWTA